MAATGVPMRPLSAGELSDNLDVTWGPGQRILYQRAGNQNYYELDPDTASERLLAKDGAPGWMFAPVYSPPERSDSPWRGIGLPNVASGSSIQ